MISKEIFIENISKITSGMRQKEIAKIMGCTEGTMSKYLNPAKTDFPTVEMLYNFAQHFNVSIDWLIGNSHHQSTNVGLSPREICKMLLSIYNSRHGFSFGEFNATEDCFIPIEYNGQYCGECTDETRNNNYIALYFSEFDQSVFYEHDDFEIYGQAGNDSPGAIQINSFLSRLAQISDMLKKGNLNQEMYDRLLDSYLNDVPA